MTRKKWEPSQYFEIMGAKGKAHDSIGTQMILMEDSTTVQTVRKQD